MKKAEKRKSRLWVYVLIAVILALMFFGMLFFLLTYSPSSPKAGTEVKNPISDLTDEEAVLMFNKEYVRYLVFAVGGWKLHNPLMSDDTPKIKVIADGEVYFSEIIDGEIFAEKKDAENEDMIITITKLEVVRAIKSLDMESYIKQSVKEGKTGFELKASYTTLFTKGYLNLYQDVTGKSLTGEIIGIFK